MGNKQAQKEINRKVDLELKRILNLSYEHKNIALKERNTLAKSTQTKLTKLRSHMAGLRRDAAKDLSKATKSLSIAVGKAVTEQQVTYAGLKGALAKAKLNTENKLVGAKKTFQAKLMTLTNVVNANNVKYE